ncbi:hypothetical protein KEJ27_06895 [Candidatus Bathyarchaeota archaeon]|nr:hypothetical protein [Candidatus Bathyarchaeota archaeon]MBS7612782.1 hypothetical protein [Candidatus Bathyarchaeota archaeon]MBS7617306.1 hypothetical protein [Candidatus Bathyarchaeota archaeon]
MNGKSIFIVLMICLGISSLILAYSRNSIGNWNPEEIALEAVRRSPTFKWDGMEDTLKVVDSFKLDENTWVVVISFTCRHSGYGDRTGKIVLQVLTEHKAEVKIVNGFVVELILDNAWDELDQKPL